jgi:hypothetical protein
MAGILNIIFFFIGFVTVKMFLKGKIIEVEVEAVNRAAKALLIKFAVTFILAVIAFRLIGRNDWGWVLAVAVTGAGLNYLLGDFYVLPKYGNIAASAVNGLLAALAAFIVSFFIPLFMVSYTALILYAVLIAVEEYLFHTYLLRTDNVAP